MYLYTSAHTHVSIHVYIKTIEKTYNVLSKLWGLVHFNMCCSRWLIDKVVLPMTREDRVRQEMQTKTQVKKDGNPEEVENS